MIDTKNGTHFTNDESGHRKSAVATSGPTAFQARAILAIPKIRASIPKLARVTKIGMSGQMAPASAPEAVVTGSLRNVAKEPSATTRERPPSHLGGRNHVY